MPIESRLAGYVEEIANSSDPFDVHNILNAKGKKEADGTPTNFLAYRETADRRMQALASLLPDRGYAVHSQEFIGSLKNKDLISYFNMHNILLLPPEPPSYLLTAHYDCVGGAGAVDNASGVAIVAHVSRILARLRKDVGFGFLDGEEAGLLGSRHLVSENMSALQNLKGVINVDAVGKGTLVKVLSNAAGRNRDSIQFALGDIAHVLLNYSQTDADSFAEKGIRASTLMSAYPEALKAYPAKNGVHVIDSRKRFINMSDSTYDQLDEISGETLAKAAEIILEVLHP